MHTTQSIDKLTDKTDLLFSLLPDAMGREKMLEILKGVSGKFEPALICRSILSRPIEAIKIGKGEKKICILASHSATESITVNIAFLLSLSLLKPDFLPSLRLLNIPLLLSKYTYYILPCLNPDGIELRLNGAGENPLSARQIKMSEGDFSAWQANARGVDLNYNYAYRFDEYKASEKAREIRPGASLYGGEWAESEPESRGVANFLRLVQPCAIVYLRTSGQSVSYTPSDARTRRIAERISGAMGYAVREEGNADSYSTLCAYTGVMLGVPSFTLRIGRGENPLPNEQIKRGFETVAKGIISLPTYL